MQILSHPNKRWRGRQAGPSHSTTAGTIRLSKFGVLKKHNEFHYTLRFRCAPEEVEIVLNWWPGKGKWMYSDPCLAAPIPEHTFIGTFAEMVEQVKRFTKGDFSNEGFSQ